MQLPFSAHWLTEAGQRKENSTQLELLPSNTIPGGHGRLPAAVLNTCDHSKIVHEINNFILTYILVTYYVVAITIHTCQLSLNSFRVGVKQLPHPK